MNRSALVNCPRCEELEELLAFYRGEETEQLHVEKIYQIRGRFGIQPGSAEAILALYKAYPRHLTKYQLDEQIPRSEIGSDRCIKIVDVRISHARTGVGFDAIETIWGRGYRLSHSGKILIDDTLGTPSVREAA